MSIARRRDLPGRLFRISLLLALGLASYFLFMFLSTRQVNLSLEAAYRSLAVNAALVAAALAAGRLPGLLLRESRQVQFGPAIQAASYVLAGLGMWRGLSSLSGQAWILPRIGMTCLSASVGMAVSHLATYAERRDFGGEASGIFRWLSESRALVVLAAACVGAYAFLVHPSFRSDWEYATLTEWILVTGAGAVILTFALVHIRQRIVGQSRAISPTWSRHSQQTVAMADAEYLRIRNLERRFVQGTNRTLLFHFLATGLAQNDVPEEDIADVLGPLVEYGHPGGHSARRQKEEKEEFLVGLADGLNAILQPSRLSSYPVRRRNGKDDALNARGPKSLGALVHEFRMTGDRGRLLVRLSMLLAQSGARAEDIEGVLRPLVSYHGEKDRRPAERDRLWHETLYRAAQVAPVLSLGGDA